MNNSMICSARLPSACDSCIVPSASQSPMLCKRVDSCQDCFGDFIPMKLVLTAASAGVATACLANAAHRGGMAAVGAGRFFYQIGAKRDFVMALQEGNSATRNAAIALVSTAVGVYFVAAAFIIQTLCE